MATISAGSRTDHRPDDGAGDAGEGEEFDLHGVLRGILIHHRGQCVIRGSTDLHHRIPGGRVLQLPGKGLDRRAICQIELSGGGRKVAWCGAIGIGDIHSLRAKRLHHGSADAAPSTNHQGTRHLS